MRRDEAFAFVTDIIEEVIGIPPSALGETTNIVEEFDVDSLQLLDLLSVVEERFDVSLPDEHLARLATVGDAVDLVLAYVAPAREG
jgi:acyl carrier protein